MSLARSLLLRLAILGLTVGLSAGVAFGGPQSSFPTITTSPGIYPLPDSVTVPQSLWITQGCNTNPAACDFQATPEQLGYIHQGTTPPASPYQNQLWWNTSRSPAVLEAYQGTTWSGLTSRITLTADGDLYTSSSGTDTANTCANALTPCATIQYAANIAMTAYDWNGHNMRVHLAPTGGTPYPHGVAVQGPMPGAGYARIPGEASGSTGAGEFGVNANLQFIGDPANPDSVVINEQNTTNTPIFYGEKAAFFLVQGMKLIDPNGYTIFADYGAKLQYANVDFGAAINHTSANNGAMTEAVGNYTISGSAQAHRASRAAGITRYPNIPITVTLQGTPAFSTGFIDSELSATAFIPPSTTFVGAATGRQFYLAGSSALSLGAGVVLPGNTLGALLDFSAIIPPLPILSVAASGLGAGGSAAPNPNGGVISDPHSGSIQLTSGTSGAASNGSFTITFPTAQMNTCVANPSSNFAAGSTVFYGALSSDHTQVTFIWTNAAGALTANTNYYATYVCTANSP